MVKRKVLSGREKENTLHASKRKGVNGDGKLTQRKRVNGDGKLTQKLKTVGDMHHFRAGVRKGRRWYYQSP